MRKRSGASFDKAFYNLVAQLVPDDSFYETFECCSQAHWLCFSERFEYRPIFPFYMPALGGFFLGLRMIMKTLAVHELIRRGSLDISPVEINGSDGGLWRRKIGEQSLDFGIVFLVQLVPLYGLPNSTGSGEDRPVPKRHILGPRKENHHEVVSAVGSQTQKAVSDPWIKNAQENESGIRA